MIRIAPQGWLISFLLMGLILCSWSCSPTPTLTAIDSATSMNLSLESEPLEMLSTTSLETTAESVPLVGSVLFRPNSESLQGIWLLRSARLDCPIRQFVRVSDQTDLLSTPAQAESVKIRGSRSTPRFFQAEQIQSPPVGGQFLPVTSETLIGDTRFFLEVALTPAQQQTGLKFRDDLAPHEGMVFPIVPRRSVAIVTSDVLVDLDVIFVDREEVISIAANTPPLCIFPLPALFPRQQTSLWIMSWNCWG
ncbi:MAG: DUF192 domain-containing protein, partial [Synechococcaceae cyanobacterium SM2_3_1]|nr:DUF192 domain-containing protein [Synechococcaceae cyanobacterium SM2_3_1]